MAEMRPIGTLSAALLGLIIAPQTAFADTLQVSSLYAGGITWEQIITSITQTLGYTIFSVSAAAFLLGALMYISGFVSEENKSKGKNLMIGSLFGMAIVIASLAIFNTAYFFVYGT